MIYTVYTKSDIYCLKFYTRFRFLFPKHALSKNAHFLGQREKNIKCSKMEFLNLLFIYSPHVFYSHNLIYLKNIGLLNYLF